MLLVAIAALDELSRRQEIMRAPAVAATLRMLSLGQCTHNLEPLSIVNT